MNLLRLLTLQILEGRTSVEEARAIVIARAARNRENRGGVLRRFHRRKPASVMRELDILQMELLRS
jgi:hypothetical protein